MKLLKKKLIQEIISNKSVSLDYLTFFEFYLSAWIIYDSIELTMDILLSINFYNGINA